MPTDIDLDRLIAARFEHTGTWRRNEVGNAVCEGRPPDAPEVYVFVVDRTVRYVGSAQKSLSARMQSYARRQQQRDKDKLQSNRLVHRKLGEAIDKKNAVVDVYTLVINDPIENERGLPVDHAIGLEGGLIRAVDPAWNRQGRKKKRLVLDDIDDT